MIAKLIFGFIAMTLMTVFVGAVFVKLKDPALGVVILIGLGMMAYEFYEFLHEDD
jgi:hypothetical protein